MDNYDIYLYKRTGHNPDKFFDYPRVKKMDVPLLDISATFIRQALHEGKSVQYLVPDAVHDYLENSVMYR